MRNEIPDYCPAGETDTAAKVFLLFEGGQMTKKTRPIDRGAANEPWVSLAP